MRLFLLLLLSCTCAFSLGHTSISTIEFPHGAENSGLGESGAAFSNSLSSSFFNPANGALYGKRESINVAIDGYFELLLPSLGLGDLWHGTVNVGAFMPEAHDDWSFGFVYSMNRLDIGTITGKVQSDTKQELSWYEYDENGDSTLVWGYMADCHSYEVVQSFTISAAYKNMFAWGIGYSFYKSILFIDAKDRGGVLNAGFRAQKEFVGSKDSYIIPGAGISINGINKDSADYDDNDNDPGHPTPHLLTMGVSVEGGFRDFVYGVALFDIRREMKKDYRGEYDEPIFSPALQIGITPFLKFNNGFMLDKQGQRYEYKWGLTVGFQQKRARNFLTQWFGYSPTFSNKNFQILYSFSRAEAWGSNMVRDRQFSQTVSFAMGFGKKRKTDDLVERDELPLWEE